MIMASPNFSMDELTHSDTAARHGIDNTPNEDEKDNLYKLAMELENVRKLLNNKPIYVSSGYRCLALNELLGSKELLHTLEDWLSILLVGSLEL